MAPPTTTIAPNNPFWGGVVSVESPDIDSLRLVNPLPFWTRVYVLPWLYLYPLAYYAWLNYDTYIKSIGQSFFLSEGREEKKGRADEFRVVFWWFRMDFLVVYLVVWRSCT